MTILTISIDEAIGVFKGKPVAFVAGMAYGDSCRRCVCFGSCTIAAMHCTSFLRADRKSGRWVYAEKAV
jgi:hypothetical protein